MKKSILILSATLVIITTAWALTFHIDRDVSIGKCKMHISGTANVGWTGGSFTGSITFGSECEGLQSGKITWRVIQNNNEITNLETISGTEVLTNPEIKAAAIAILNEEVN